MAVLKLSVVAALLGCGEALALRPSLSMQHAAGSSLPTTSTSAAAGRRTWLAKLSIGAGAVGAAALGRPGPARADVQYELGPLKLVTEDDPSLQPPKLNMGDMIDPSKDEPVVTDRAYMKILVDGEPAGVLNFDLYGKVAPKTVENFLALCEGTGTGSASYKGSSVFRVIDGQNVGLGDIAGKGDKCVKSGTCVSAFGGPFLAETYSISHSVSGLVSMARGLTTEGETTVDSRIFITPAADAKWADGRYVAFGRLNQKDDSMQLLERLQKLEVQGAKNIPKKTVIIGESGIIR